MAIEEEDGVPEQAKKFKAPDVSSRMTEEEQALERSIEAMDDNALTTAEREAQQEASVLLQEFHSAEDRFSKASVKAEMLRIASIKRSKK